MGRTESKAVAMQKVWLAWDVWVRESARFSDQLKIRVLAKDAAWPPQVSSVGDSVVVVLLRAMGIQKTRQVWRRKIKVYKTSQHLQLSVLVLLRYHAGYLSLDIECSLLTLFLEYENENWIQHCNCGLAPEQCDIVSFGLQTASNNGN